MDKRKGYNECACELCHEQTTGPDSNYCDPHTPGTEANLALRAALAQARGETA